MDRRLKEMDYALAGFCKSAMQIAVKDIGTSHEILRGGGGSGGIVAQHLNIRKISNIRISEDALSACLEHDISPYDYFMLVYSKSGSADMEKKYGVSKGKFFRSQAKTVEKAHSNGQYITADHNLPNKVVMDKMFNLCKQDYNASVDKYFEILNQQSLDLITVEENQNINNAGLKSSGSKLDRDALCSNKINFTEYYITPNEIVDKLKSYIDLNLINSLNLYGRDINWTIKDSCDEIPPNKLCLKKSFLSLNKNDLNNITTIIGRPAQELAKASINKILELNLDAYLLIHDSELIKEFNDNIDKIFTFNFNNNAQSICEFQCPFFEKTNKWSFIVHITTNKNNNNYEIKENIQNDKDNYIQIGDNSFIHKNFVIQL